MTTAFAPLPTAFELPASNPPYPPAVGSASRAHSIAVLRPAALCSARSNHSRKAGVMDEQLQRGCRTLLAQRETGRHKGKCGIDLVISHTTVTPKRSVGRRDEHKSHCCYWDIPANAGSACPVTVTNAVTKARSATNPADTTQTRCGTSPEIARLSVHSDARPYDDKSWEGVFARGLPHSRIFIGRNGAREVRCLAKRELMLQSRAKGSLSGSRGVGGKNRARGISDLLSFFRAPSEITCCLRATPNFGRPVLKISGAQ